MAAGSDLSEGERERLETAVHAAESATGLQFLIYIGKSRRDTRKSAEQFMAAQGYNDASGVLVFVSPKHKSLEVVTSEKARLRISDEQAQKAVDIMVPAFRKGDWISGVELGLSCLAEEAGPPRDGEPQGPDLPNVH